MTRTAILLAAALATLFALTACPDGSGESARIEREVARRVEAERKAMNETADRLHTLRVVGFVILTVAAVGGLIWLLQPRVPAPMDPPVARIPAAGQPDRPAMRIANRPPHAGRVIDMPRAAPPTLPAPAPSPDQPSRPPQSRQSHHGGRRRARRGNLPQPRTSRHHENPDPP